MFGKFRKNVTKKVTPKAEASATNEEVFEKQVEAREEAEPAADNIDSVELEPLNDDYDDYTDDIEGEDIEDPDEDEDDDDYISDEEWEKMTPAQRKAWEDGEDDYEDEDGEGGIDDDYEGDEDSDESDPDYISSSPEMVGFDSEEQQLEIYEYATEDIEPNESVLDVGCGRGDMYRYLYERDGQVPKYRGIDINEPLINAGLEKYAPDIDLEHKNWFDKDITASTWCINVGSLCARYDSSKLDNMALVQKTIDKMMSMSKVGCVLVLFSSYMPEDQKEDDYIITDPKVVFDYVMKKYGEDTGNVILDHSYSDSLYRITILK